MENKDNKNTLNYVLGFGVLTAVGLGVAGIVMASSTATTKDGHSAHGTNNALKMRLDNELITKKLAHTITAPTVADWKAPSALTDNVRKALKFHKVVTAADWTKIYDSAAKKVYSTDTVTEAQKKSMETDAKFLIGGSFTDTTNNFALEFASDTVTFTKLDATLAADYTVNTAGLSLKIDQFSSKDEKTAFEAITGEKFSVDKVLFLLKDDLTAVTLTDFENAILIDKNDRSIKFAKTFAVGADADAVKADAIAVVKPLVITTKVIFG